MFIALLWLIYWTGGYPLWQAWRANRHTSLLHAANWMIGSWAAWGLVFAAEAFNRPALGPATRYVALCLTGCAGVAVLGARRPGVGAWNFVVVGLLAVQLLPWAEGALAGGGLQLGGFRTVFLAATLAVGILNYLPTRLAAGALLLGLGCALEIVAVLEADNVGHTAEVRGWLLLGCAPWAAYGAMQTRPAAPSEFDRLWLDFRDRYGFVWAQRLREQFNRSVAHAGWPVILRWQGLRLLPGSRFPEPAIQEALLDTLGALRKRFTAESVTDASTGPPAC
jgi:hypothetical protein